MWYSALLMYGICVLPCGCSNSEHVCLCFCLRAYVFVCLFVCVWGGGGAWEGGAVGMIVGVCECVCVCVYARVRACVRVCGRIIMWARSCLPHPVCVLSCGVFLSVYGQSNYSVMQAAGLHERRGAHTATGFHRGGAAGGHQPRRPITALELGPAKLA